MTEFGNFRERLLKRLKKPDIHGELKGEELLNRYFSLTAEAGKEFEFYRKSTTQGEINEITPADLIAVTLMSVRIHNGGQISLASVLKLERDSVKSDIQELLVQLDPNIELHLVREDAGPVFSIHEIVDRASALHEILYDIGITSNVARHKLLARKRPLLLPVRDRVVANALGQSDQNPRKNQIVDQASNWYRAWHSALTHDNTFVDMATVFREEAQELGENQIGKLGILRVLDIVIWEGAMNREKAKRSIQI